ncbi:hypothetical protein [Flavobacterium proteolyticum]|uniref:Uncharacterized protein n=1 Tax=Flavobacterium proteolyticum TaxID=2911683 RepID=A0ABR9WQ81_9FLAO|nr:hypothetical protein [Flavobacterium proteolyticum]MBE9576078.1 hypothetical protein [Flavobacterium proteolyticum]
MKKIILLLFVSYFLIYCQKKTEKLTPVKYISKINIEKQIYSKDSLTLVSSIQKDISEHKGGYHSKTFDAETLIIIDTIMYSPNNERIFFFVITKSQNKKLYPKEMSEQEMSEASKYSNLALDGSHFQGKAYVAYKKNDTILRTQFYGITTSEYENIESVRQRQRNIFFKEFSAVNEKGYEYNVDDKRFWDNDYFWDKMNRELENEKEFEEMKITNPENIYENPRSR